MLKYASLKTALNPVYEAEIRQADDTLVGKQVAKRRTQALISQTLEIDSTRGRPKARIRRVVEDGAAVRLGSTWTPIPNSTHAKPTRGSSPARLTRLGLQSRCGGKQ